jgi:hypothetical protein
VSGGGTDRSAVALTKGELSRLTVWFDRDSLGVDDGIQFVRITVTINRADGMLHEKISERAFTFARGSSPEDDDTMMRGYAKTIHPLGFASRRKIDSVDIELDGLPEWGIVEVRAEPDEDYAAYASHRGNRIVWHYRARGGRVDGAFYLGIPKVLLDTRDRNDLDYGRTSAMYRIFWLNGETGDRFPVNIGFGVFGVRSPIDVSSAGGGYAVSGLLDLFEVARHFGLDLTNKVNAGVEVVPFFPVNHPARVLVALRVGIAP